MRLKIRRILTISALIITLAVLTAIGYAIWLWSAGTWAAFGATMFLILGACFVVAGLLVLPVGVSLAKGDKASMIAAQAYVANLTKTPEPAIAGPVYTITQLPNDPDIHTWSPWKQDDGNFALIPFRKKDGLPMWDLAAVRDVEPTQENIDKLWQIANVKRRELGWIR